MSANWPFMVVESQPFPTTFWTKVSKETESLHYDHQLMDESFFLDRNLIFFWLLLLKKWNVNLRTYTWKIQNLTMLSNTKCTSPFMLIGYLILTEKHLESLLFRYCDLKMWIWNLRYTREGGTSYWKLKLSVLSATSRRKLNANLTTLNWMCKLISLLIRFWL